MNSLRVLSNPILLNTTDRLVREERRITVEVLQHFREIERRKAYADLDCKSLFEYAVKHLRYSEGSASRRIAAMYALKEHPELGTQIQDGVTSVTTVAKIHTTLRRDEKISSIKRTIEEKKQIFSEIVSLPNRELEKKLFAIAPQGSFRENVRPVAEDLHEVKAFLNSEELAAFEEFGGWVAHSLRIPASPSEILKKLLQLGREKYLEQFKMLEKKSGSTTAQLPRSNQKDRPSQRDASPLTGKQPSKEPKRPSRHTQRLLFQRARFNCEYTYSSGKKCGSSYSPQQEHVKPQSMGGRHVLPNLERLCRAHNLIRGIRIFGPDKMRRN